ncbi:MAG: MBL fold metallo-hydrolase [Acidobacteriota bacterium]|nr:MBL fold metallo-hydrolase [Acidobacteriota bacterium]
MRTNVRFGLAGFLVVALWVPATAAHPLEVSVDRARGMLVKEDLGDGIYVYRAPSDLDYWTATNSVVIVNDDDVTVFDSCTRAITARAVIAEIRKLTPKPVRVLINSHWHQDHWSGNDEYAKAFPGLRIISSAETRAYMSRMGPRFFVDELAQFGLNKMREDLEAAIKTGKLGDGSPLTSEIRARKEANIATASQFSAEIAALPRVLPNLVYRKEMAFWSGRREHLLMSLTGDATASTVLYLPGHRVLVTGDVLASPEDGKGPPPWTTSSYAVTPWLESLRRLDSLDVRLLVPGQGPTMHEKSYLRRTIQLFAAIIDQVHAALERGLVKVSDVQAAVDVDPIGLEYAPGSALSEDFHLVVATLAKKAMQEALDGAPN